MKLFNEKDIQAIYNKYVIKSKEYFKRFNFINKYLSTNELKKYIEYIY